MIPLPSRAAAAKLALRLRLPTPQRVGWDGFAAVLAELRGSGLADAVGLRTLEMDPPAALGTRVLEALAATP